MQALISMITCWTKAQLSAGDLSIDITPEVITYCSPDVRITDLHTASHVIGTSLESDRPLSASYMNIKNSIYLQVHRDNHAITMHKYQAVYHYCSGR